MAANPSEEDLLTAAEEAVEATGYETAGDWYAADDQWPAIASRLD